MHDEHRTRSNKPIDWRARAERLAQMLVNRQQGQQEQLDEAIQQAKADAWDEGNHAGRRDGIIAAATIGPHRPTTNPYRKDAQ